MISTRRVPLYIAAVAVLAAACSTGPSTAVSTGQGTGQGTGQSTAGRAGRGSTAGSPGQRTTGTLGRRAPSAARLVDPSAGRPTHPSSGIAPSTSATHPTVRPLLPIQHHGSHPGAAALHGDVRPVPKAAYIPSVWRAPTDSPGYGACQVDQTASTPTYCSFGYPAKARLTIALVGDSVAGEWLGALNKIADLHRWKIVTALHSRCPWTASMTVNLGTKAPYTACRAWGAIVLHRLLTTIRPTLVITSDRPVLGTPHHPPGATASTIIGRGMALYWRRLIAHHIDVVALRESPEIGVDIPKCLTRTSASRCAVARSRAVARTTPITVARELVTTHGAQLLDLTNLICATHTCRPIVGNVLVYRDVHHLTTTYTLTIAPYLERMLLRAPALAAA